MKGLPVLCRQGRRFSVVTKISPMEPEQLTPQFCANLAISFGQHPTRPSMLVGIALRSGCIELVMDLVSLSEDADKNVLLDTSLPFPDPSVWLHHLHVLPPPGTQVLTQACGRCGHIMICISNIIVSAVANEEHEHSKHTVSHSHICCLHVCRQR